MKMKENVKNPTKRLIVGISGASDIILGIEMLKIIKENVGWQIHLVISKSAKQILSYESKYKIDDLVCLADKVYSIEDIGANIASGTFKSEGMIVIPCSMKTVAGIACGYSDNLLLRAADVIIKEKRKLILVPRESPLSVIHLKNMLFLAQLGVIIMPPMITYYNNPHNLEEVNRQIIGNILDKFGIQVSGFYRWDNKNDI